jgi:hypothetical protein
MINPVPGYRLIIIGNWPHLGQVVCPARLCCSLKEVLVSWHKDVTLSLLDSNMAARENNSDKKNRYKMETEIPSFLLLLICGPKLGVRSAFQQKQFEHLLQGYR